MIMRRMLTSCKGNKGQLFILIIHSSYSMNLSSVEYLRRQLKTFSLRDSTDRFILIFDRKLIGNIFTS